MENATFNISFFCRNARLSLQKAAFSRRSHMLSEELEHLRNFESVVLETLPHHPLYSAKRGEKEILELEFYLPDVRKRLAELEGKHPFLYKHHHKGGNSVHGSNSRTKRVKESHETFKAQKASSRPPSSSSSSSRKVLPAPISEHSRRSLPMPGKRSPTVHCARSPSLRSNSSGSLVSQKRKCSPVGATYMSALDRFVDESVLPSQELKLPSKSMACRDTYDDDLGFPSQKSKLSSSGSFNSPKYVDDFRFLPTKSKLLSDNGKYRPGVSKYVNEAGFSSHKSKLPTSDDTRCRSSLENYVDDLGFPSPKTPMKPSIGDYSSWIAHGSDTGDYTGETLMEGFVVHSDRSDDTEDFLGSTSLYEELGRQRLQNLTGEFCSQRGHDSMEDFPQDDEISLPDLIAETVHDMRASSSPSQKRPAFSFRSNGKGKRGKDAVDATWSSFQELGSALDDYEYRKTHSSSASKNAREPARNTKENERALAGLTLTENLEEALKRLGSLQESDDSFEEPDTSRNEEKTSLRAYTLETPSKLLGTEKMATDAEDLSFAGASSRRSLFGKDASAEARRVSFHDLTWSENDVREGEFEYSGADSKTDSFKKQIGETDTNFLEGKDGLAQEERAKFKEKSWEESSIRESRTMQQEDNIVAEDVQEVDNVYEVGKEVSEERNMHKLGSLRSKADQKKKVKFEKNFTGGTELEDSLEASSMSVDQQTQPEAGGRSLNSRHSSSGTEERLKSILGDCSYVASQLNTLGEAGRGSMGLHNDSDAEHGSLADIHIDRNAPSPIVESNVRGDCLHNKQVSGRPLEGSDKLQVSELMKRMDGFQRILNELKNTVLSSSIHVEEQINICQAKVKGMEGQLDAVKMETSSELLGLKRFVKSKFDKKMEKGGSMKDISIDGFLDEKLQKKMDECTLKTDSLQKQLDSWLSRMQVELRIHVDEAVASSVDKFESSLKTDLEKLELQRLRDLGNLKKEMGLRLSLHESKEQLNKKPEKQLDLIVMDVLEKQFSHFVEVLFAEKEKALTELQNELSHLKNENESHRKGRAEVREHMEIMTCHLEEVKTRLDKDKEDCRSLKDSVKKQLHAIRNEGVQVRFLFDNMKKEKDSQVDDLRLSIDNLRTDTTECKEKILGLRNVEKLLSEEQADLKKSVEIMQKARCEEHSELESLKKLKNDFEKGKSSEVAAEREGALIMERVESLSQLYLGGLGEVRTELKDLKLHFQVKFDEIELSTKASLLSSLEARILELEKEHNCTQALENKAEDILAIVGKHRKLASAAATDAAASAHKAEESLAELLGFISSEMNNTKKKSSKLQESLVSDRETSSSLLLEMMTISAELRKEKEAALAAASIAKKHIEDVVQSFENELAKLRLDRSKVEKDRDSLRSLAEEMAGSAAKAEKDRDSLRSLAEEMASSAAKANDVLHELMEVRQKSVELSGEVLAEVTETKRKSTELAEEVVAEMVNIKKKSIELSQDVVAEMSNTKRKTVKFGQEVLGEITNTQRVGLQLQEAAAKEMAALQTKAEEVLSEITRAKRKSLQIQEDVVAEAASWASRAEELIADITTASNKTAQCKEAAVKEAATLANKAEEVLEEMVSLRRKSTQIHEHTSEVIKNAVQLVQEQCDIETHGWKEAMEGEVRKVKSFCVEIEQMKANTISPLNTENVVMKRDFAEHVAKTDSMLQELTGSVIGLTQFISPLRNCGSGEHDQTRNDVKHLNQRVETIASMLEAMFRLNAKPGEAKLQDLLPEWQQLAGRCSLSELEKRIISLEASHLDLSKKAGEVQSKAEELEKSVVVWLPKYDAAARVLNEVEGRLVVLETSARNDLKSEKRLSELDEKEPFLSFYKDLGSGRNTDEGRWSPLEVEKTLHNLDMREKGVIKSLDARIIILESRIEHVASATYTNLRILDTKAEHINGSLETALESATMAEKKCNLLGAELVKVFRMLANSGKPSPEKSLSSRGGESSFRHHFLKPDESASKRKEPHFSARMNLKKHGSSSSSSFQHLKNGPSAGGKDRQSGSKKAFSVLRCNFETFESEDEGCGSESNPRVSQNRLNKFADKWTQAPKVRQESSACTTDTPLGNGKLRETVGEPQIRVHSKGDNSDQDSNLFKNSQKTDFHINSGKVHVNVSHKSRLFK